VIAVPPKPFTDTASRALVIAEVDGGSVRGDVALDTLVERQLAAGADLVVLTGDLSAEPASEAVRHRLVLDVGVAPSVDLQGAPYVSGLVDRWDDRTAEAVARSGAVVLVRCADAGSDQDPTLPRFRASLERAMARLVAAGAAPDRIVIDTKAAPDTPIAGWVALLQGHRQLTAAGPVVGSIPPASVLTKVAAALAPSVDDVEAAAVAVAAVLAASGCRGIRSAWPSVVRRVVTVQDAIDGARR
jgi:hypothetical protein